MPQGAEARAAVAILIAAKYRLVERRVPRLRAALGLDTAEVAAAAARQLGPGRNLYVEAPTWRERLAWRRAAFAQRIEVLPPFWVAYSLALTETITEGILIVPVAVAGIGPMAGIVVLVALGIINLLTLGAMVEAITRNGSMRYGAGYLGRLVNDLLGLPGSVGMSVALGLLNAVVLLAYLLGFGSVLHGATGIGEEVWVALLFAVNVWILRRGTLDETVATAVVIGAVNVALILAITGIAFAHIDPANLATRNLPLFGGSGLEPAMLQLVFGVIIVAYFGHTSAANASKLILGRDPSGRSLLWGNLAALATVIGLYSLIVIAINGAVGAEPLIETRGTAITPLAEVVGPVIDVLGSVYVVLAVGLGSLYCSLGLYNQVIEYLPARSRRTEGGWAARLATGRGRLLAGIAPVAATFLVLEYLLVTDQDWFARPVAVIGVLTVPLLGGIFPMLLVLAARRRGEYVPGTVIGVLGHPVTVAVVCAIFLAGIALHGLVIWTDPLERAAALVVAGLTAALLIWILRGPAFRRTAAIEIRDAQGGASVDPGFTVTVGGRPLAAHVELEHRDGRTDLQRRHRRARARRPAPRDVHARRPRRPRRHRLGAPRHARGRVDRHPGRRGASRGHRCAVSADSLAGSARARPGSRPGADRHHVRPALRPRGIRRMTGPAATRRFRAPAVLRRSLRARLVAYFVLLAVVTVALLSLLVNARATDYLGSSVAERLDAAAALKVDAVEEWLEEQRRSVIFTAGLLGGATDDSDAIRTLLLDDGSAAEIEDATASIRDTLAYVADQSSDSEELAVLDASGTIRVSTVPEHEGASQAGETFFERGSTSTTVEGVVESSLTGEPTIAVATPIFDASGERVGVLAEFLDLVRLDRIARERTGLGATGEAFLVGGDGRLISNAIGASAGEEIDSPGVSAALDGTDGQARYDAQSGTPVIGAWRWVQELNAVLVAELTEQEAFAPARELAGTIALVGLAAVAVLGLGIAFVSRAVTRPIQLLAATATEVAGGNLDATAPDHVGGRGGSARTGLQRHDGAAPGERGHARAPGRGAHGRAAPTEHRARHRQRGRAGARDAARLQCHPRGGRRAGCRGPVGEGPLDRDEGPRDRHRHLPLLDRRGEAEQAVRGDDPQRPAHRPDHRGPQADPHRHGGGGGAHRCAVQGRWHRVVPRRADPCRRQVDRCDRHRHARAERVQRGRRAAAHDTRHQHGRRPRQRPPVR